MMKTKSNPAVVIDTNLFISAIIRGGIPYRLLNVWQQDKITLATTNQLFEEITEVFTRREIYEKYSLDQGKIQLLLDGIKLNAKFVTPIDTLTLPLHSRDQKDDKLLTTALSGEVDYLVTGDKDLLVLNGNPSLGSLEIITAREFLSLIKS